MPTKETRVWSARIEAEVIDTYNEMASTIDQGLREMGVPPTGISGPQLMRDNLAGGAATYRRILDKHKTPLEVVRALSVLQEAKAS